MKNKKIPLRTCIVTKENLPKSELLRIVRRSYYLYRCKISLKKLSEQKFSEQNPYFCNSLTKMAKNHPTGRNCDRVYTKEEE